MAIKRILIHSPKYGEIYRWGSKDKGYSGHGDLEKRNTSTSTPFFKRMNVMNVMDHFEFYYPSFVLLENNFLNFHI